MLKTLSKLTKKDILEKFYSVHTVCKKQIGFELERLCVNNKLGIIPYMNYTNTGVKNLLDEIATKYNWEKIFDNNVLVGLKKQGTTITLEPGCQFELSVKPQNSVSDLKNYVDEFDSEIASILNKMNIKLLEYPISPVINAQDIKVYPKKRYQYMAKYLSGRLASSMMRETAGIQVTIDYSDESDAIKKLRAFTKLSPVMTAIFANSPIKDGRLTGYKSTRALAWLHTDENRCGLINEKLFDKNYNFRFSDYIDAVCNVPMLYISRYSNTNNMINPIPKDTLINGKITFNQYLESGYNNLTPEIKDYELQQSLYFPEVRLKNYLEIRNHDCQKSDLKYAIPAIYKGLAYDDITFNNLVSLLDEFTYEDIQNARYDVPKYALDTKIGNKNIYDIAKEVIRLAKDGLKNDTDTKYIEQAGNLINEHLCPADLIIKDYGKNLNLKQLLLH